MQFSLKTIIVAVFLVAAICGLFFAIPIVYVPLSIVGTVVVLATLLISIMVFDKGYGRAFAVGGFASLILAYLTTSHLGFNLSIYDGHTLRETFAYLLVLVALSGCMSMFVFWATVADQPEYKEQKKGGPSRIAQLTSGLILGLLMGGSVAIAGQVYGPAPAPTPFASPGVIGFGSPISPIYPSYVVPPPSLPFPVPAPAFSQQFQPVEPDAADDDDSGWRPSFEPRNP